MLSSPDVLIYNTIGPAFTSESIKTVNPGGSELEVARIAHGLADHGHSVVLANGVREESVIEGVKYVPFEKAAYYWPKKALFIERYSDVTHLKMGLKHPFNPKIVVRAMDAESQETDATAIRFDATLVGLSKWQLESFFSPKKEVIPPILGQLTEKVEKVPGRFIFGSGPIKGLTDTVKMWMHLKLKYPELESAHLLIMSPGWGDFNLTPGATDPQFKATFVGSPPPAEYERLVASAEGLFFVNTFVETFCCVAALAERDKTRTHILCKAGLGGIPEAVTNMALVTTDPEWFEKKFMECWRLRASPDCEHCEKWYANRVPDLSAKAIIPKWETVLGLV